MATFFQASPLLALPFELRTKIYEELLCPHPRKTHQLYHDRDGRETPFNLHPSILRVNQQIHSESADLIYNNNTFEIHLTTTVVKESPYSDYQDLKPNPPPLFRQDMLDASQYNTVKRGLSTHPRFQGIIYSHCFQRLRRIKIVTRKAAIWGWNAVDGYYFSHTGELIMQILRALAEEVPAPTPIMKLDFEIWPDWRTKYGLFQAGLTDAIDGKAVEIVALLKSIQRSRKVLLVEKVKPDERGKPLERVDVDIDGLVAEFSRGSHPGS